MDKELRGLIGTQRARLPPLERREHRSGRGVAGDELPAQRVDKRGGQYAVNVPHGLGAPADREIVQDTFHGCNVERLQAHHPEVGNEVGPHDLPVAVERRWPQIAARKGGKPPLGQILAHCEPGGVDERSVLGAREYLTPRTLSRFLCRNRRRLTWRRFPFGDGTSSTKYHVPRFGSLRGALIASSLFLHGQAAGANCASSCWAGLHRQATPYCA